MVKVAPRAKTKRRVRERRLATVLNNYIAKDAVGMSAEELSILNDQAKTIRVSDEIATALCRQVSPENPEAMKVFLQQFAHWVKQKEEHNPRRKS